MKDDAIKVLENTKSITLATINEDGSPWATPLLAYYENGNIVWNSSANAQHSKNIARDNRVSISLWYEDKEASVFRAAYIVSRADITGETIHNDEFNKDLNQYAAAVGEINQARSEVDRYYFDSSGDLR